MPWLRRSNLWRSNNGKPNVTQKNSMEAKKPKVYGGYLILVRKRDPFSVETYNRGQNTLRRYFIDYS